MDTVDRNYLIKLDNVKQADEVFDLLESLGEPINNMKFAYSSTMWFYIGFYTNTNEWTIAGRRTAFGNNVISFKGFIDKYSTVKSKPVVEDYTGKTIRALINSPQGTGVQIGEEIKILKLTYSESCYVLDKTAKGTSGMWINRPLNLKEWELVGESIVPVKEFSEFPTDGCFRFDGVHNDDIIKHLKSTKPSAVELYSSHTFVAWNNSSYWFCQSSGKTEYNWEQLAKFVTNKVNMQEIQEECKRRFPIGCSYHSPGDITRRVLIDGSKTYTIFSDMIYAHAGGGCLYDNGSYATIYSLPEEKPFKSRFKIGDWIMWDGRTKSGPYKLTSVKGTGFLDQNDEYRGTEDTDYRLATKSEIPEETQSIPKYVLCVTSSLKDAIKGRVYPVISEFKCKCENDEIYYWNTPEFKPSTKEAYDAQFTTLYDGCSKGIESLIEKEIDSRYQMGYDDPKVKTKPLIEDVQSVSVKLSTKRKINNKFKF